MFMIYLQTNLMKTLGKKRVLRSNTKTIEYMDEEKLLNDLLDFEEEIDLSNKLVRFNDTDNVLTF